MTEADLDLYDAYNADEIFITSTSLCLCPAVSVNGVHVGSGVGADYQETRRCL